MRRETLAILAIAIAVCAAPASAQVDPLLFLKGSPPNVIIMTDTSERMQRDAPTNPSTVATSNATSNYYDPSIYARTGAGSDTLGVPADSTTYRRTIAIAPACLPVEPWVSTGSVMSTS